MALIQGSCQRGGLRADYAAATDPGRVRRGNEDDLLLLPECGVFAVADGLGGLEAGDVASRTALAQLRDGCTRAAGRQGGVPGGQDHGGAILPLAEIIARVNAQTYDQRLALGKNMATTLALVQFAGTAAAIAHVGDSRIYRFRRGQLSRLTSDHSLVNELFLQGALSASQLEHSPQRHILTRAVGAEPAVAAEIRELSIEPAELLLLCTDGVTTMLNDQRIAAEIRTCQGDPAGTVLQLMRSALDAGGQDNITLIVLAFSGSSAAR